MGQCTTGMPSTLGFAMTPFATMLHPRDRDVVAPDGSDVRVLLGLAGGGVAEFELAAGQVSTAVTHRTVEEIWYVLRGRGEIETHFQFRALGDAPLAVLGITMPPWPGACEASVVAGPWAPTVPTA